MMFSTILGDAVVDTIPTIIAAVLAILLPTASCDLVSQSDDLPSREGLVALPLDCHRTDLSLRFEPSHHSYASTSF